MNLIATLKTTLASTLSSDPGSRVVDLAGCYIHPLIALLDAVASGTAEQIDAAAACVLELEERLAHPGRPRCAPVRVVASETALASLAPDSIICSPWHPQTMFQHLGSGVWSEPGAGTASSAVVWEILTGGYEEIILPEDREVWVLFDAASPPRRPKRADSSPDWLTVAVIGATETHTTHHSLAEAQTAISALCSQPGGAPGQMYIWHREKDSVAFASFDDIDEGTTADRLDWAP